MALRPTGPSSGSWLRNRKRDKRKRKPVVRTHTNRAVDRSRVWVAALPVFFALSGYGQYPHRADLESVSGRWTGTQAEVVWRTVQEYGTAGFRVVRQVSGGEVPLHDGWIWADITRPVGEYTAVDPEGQEGAGATYRIEELRGEGTVVTLGTWSVTFDEPPAEPVVRAMAAEPLFAPLSEPEPVAAPAAKVRVASNDVFAVTYEALGAVLGLTAGEVADRAAEASLVMRCGGEPVAYWADDAGQRLLFYGRQAKSRYTRHNVYWIEPGSPGAGRLMQRLTPGDEPVEPDPTFVGRVDFEQDLFSMVDHSGTLREDLYFWNHVQVNTSSQQMERTFDAPLEGYAGGDVAVTVRLTGWNDTPANPDHKVEVRFNGTLIGTFTFDGKADVEQTFSASAATVLPSGNGLRIKGILQPGLTSSTFVIQGFSLGYEQHYAPRSGPLEADDGGHGRLAAEGYTDPFVLDVTDPYSPVRVADDNGGLPAGWSWPAGADTRWIYRERAAVPALMPVAAGHGGWLRSATNAVDYLVIAPRAFEGPANALADYRAGQGLRTAVAYYEDICDQFAQGRNTPEAIRSLLIYAHDTWAAAPWMAVLGGWGHYDYYGAQTSADNFLPPLLASDSRTLRPADGLFADLTGDGVPDLAIGRIPAQNVTQFSQYIAKLQAYEAGGVKSWHQNAFFIADNADDGGDFAATNLELSSAAAPRYTPSFTALDTRTAAQVRADIRAAFTNGSGIIHYTGHGSITVFVNLTHEKLLAYDDAKALVNPPVPLFISLTCLIGRFDLYQPTQRSLAEGLVLNASGGSLAVYAPAGLSWNHYAGLFGEELYRLHAGEQADTIGLLLLRARRSFGVLSGLHADAIRTYNLLGDPALKLRGGAGGSPPWWISTLASWRWERLSYLDLAFDGGHPGTELFEEYVSGGADSGLRLTQERGGAAGRAVVRWEQRRGAEDLEYRLMISTNLTSGVWQEAPADMEVVRTVLPDPVRERVEAGLSFSSEQIFMRLEVLSK